LGLATFEADTDRIQYLLDGEPIVIVARHVCAQRTVSADGGQQTLHRKCVLQ